MLQLLSALGLYQLTTLVSSMKFIKHHQIYKESQAQAFAILQSLEQNLPSISPACFIQTSSVTWMDKSASGSCQGEYKGHVYAFFVEFLDRNECDFVDINQRVSAKYYRITLVLSSTNHLQSIVAYPEKPLQDCRGRRHRIRVGRQMWRTV